MIDQQASRFEKSEGTITKLDANCAAVPELLSELSTMNATFDDQTTKALPQLELVAQSLQTNVIAADKSTERSKTVASDLASDVLNQVKHSAVYAGKQLGQSIAKFEEQSRAATDRVHNKGAVIFEDVTGRVREQRVAAEQAGKNVLDTIRQMDKQCSPEVTAKELQKRIARAAEKLNEARMKAEDESERTLRPIENAAKAAAQALIGKPAQKVNTIMQDALKGASDGVKEAVEKLTPAANATEGGVRVVVHGVEQVVKQATDKATELVRVVEHDLAPVSDAVKKAEQGAADIVKQVTDKADEVRKEVADTGKQVIKETNRLADDAYNKADEVRKEVVDTGKQVIKETNRLADDAYNKADELKKQTSRKINETLGRFFR